MCKQVRFVIVAVTLWVAAAATSFSPGARAAAPDPLAPGVYATTITLADIPSSFPPEAIEILIGSWELEFFEDRTVVARKSGETVVTGRYVANPGHLVVRDTGGTLACTEPGTATGVYTIGIAGDQVTATTIHDRCAGRELVMTTHPWEKL